mmetsp:Transcript_2841/g.11277  ORF Transcript_2841/g.11277 Transcript_2841/m.11277 type:complete len:204 (+) Transcript_2841:724-1335(+)
MASRRDGHRERTRRTGTREPSPSHAKRTRRHDARFVERRRRRAGHERSCARRRVVRNPHRPVIASPAPVARRVGADGSARRGKERAGYGVRRERRPARASERVVPRHLSRPAARSCRGRRRRARGTRGRAGVRCRPRPGRLERLRRSLLEPSSTSTPSPRGYTAGVMMRFSRCFFSRAFSWANRRGDFLRQTRPVHGGKQRSV